jgi:haloacetate dehalogenase
MHEPVKLSLPDSLTACAPWSSTGPAWQGRVDCGEVRLNVRIDGQGPPVVLLHGYPQTHRMWRRCLAHLRIRRTWVLPDLRGYGDSDKPRAFVDDPARYSKRTMARDLRALMDRLGIAGCPIIGHDRGARVVHRFALDFPERASRAGVIDILPTAWHFAHWDAVFARAYWHWSFLAAPDGEPERLIAPDPEGFLRRRLDAWSRTPGAFDETDLSEYVRCFRDPDCLHATCEDYRAAATVDLEHDAADAGRRIAVPLLVGWGRLGFIGSHYDPAAVWSAHADRIEARTIECGHFPAEEAPEALADLLAGFLT